MELWDAYTADGELTDIVLVRGNPVPAGLYHMVCEVLVRHVDGTFLLMQRDFDKPTYPGKWEATAGGSALRSEDRFACVKRELREETGLSGHTFAYLGDTFDEEDRTLYVSFICLVDCDKDTITLQEGETVDFRWIGADEMRGYLASDDNVDRQVERFSGWYRKMGLIK